MAAAAPLPVRLPVLANVVPGARVRDAALVTGAALLTALLAQVAIPVAGSPVPITGQTLAVVLTAAALGPARGVAGQALYLLLGAVGLPFYTDSSGGVEVVVGATGGYLLGFLPAALLIGLAAQQGHDRRVSRALPLFIAGQLVIFAIGVPWLAAAADLSPAQALDAGFYPFIVGGLVKAAIAGLLLPVTWKLVPNADQGRGRDRL
jgi:biotin transport system substrate-specific component